MENKTNLKDIVKKTTRDDKSIKDKTFDEIVEDVAESFTNNIK